MNESTKMIALVTGAASGIGATIAERLASQGAKVVLADIQVEQGQALAARIGGTFHHLDIASEQDWQELLAAVEQEFGRLDVLVNNAGIYRSGNVEETDIETWRRIFSINVEGVFLGCKYGIQLMKRSGGAIINMSSGAALRPNSQAAAYSASKSAVWNLTRTTALFCAERGYNIRCNSLHPGLVDSPMVANRVENQAARDKLYREYAAMHPLGRIATPADVANAVAFLASDEAAYLTGVALPVDGGYAIA